MNDKVSQYAMVLTAAVGSLFEEDSDNFINLEELQEGDNMTHFMEALANVVPTTLYNRFTGDDLNQLEFNHIANKLCFQYMHKIEDEE